MAAMQQIAGYDVMGTLGYGARSTIFAVRDGDDQIYALKRVTRKGPDDQRFLDQAISEHEVARKFDHPSLRRSIKLIRHRALIRTNEVVVLMELVDGETLEQHRPADTAQLCGLMQATARGLQAMHEAGYVHADIKPNNILQTGEDSVKIIDFGQSCPVGTVKQRIQGTPDYIAPEQVLRREITPRTDVFNLGATMYWLLTRRHMPTLIPKQGQGVVVKDDESCPPPIKVDPAVPPALSTLVMECIETDPERRPGTMKLVDHRLGLAISQLSRARAGASR